MYYILINYNNDIITVNRNLIQNKLNNDIRQKPQH